MRLAAESEVRAQLGLGSSPDYITATLAALDAATLALEHDIRTTFDSGIGIDLFTPTMGNSLTKLRLKQGFVVAGSVQVLYANTWADLQAGATKDITSLCRIDLENGLVEVMADPTTYRNRTTDSFNGLPGYVTQVTYQAGFDADLEDPLTYDMSQVPLWLNDLAKMQARISLAGHPALDATGVNTDVKNSRLPDVYKAALSRHRRYYPTAIHAR